MTALIALCDGDSVRILADGALTRLSDGVLARVRSKQIRLENGVVIAGAGIWDACCRFAAMADELASFDEVADAAQELWKEATRSLPAAEKEAPGAIVIAGLSQKTGGPDMLVIETPGDKFSDTATAYAIGPHTSAREFTGRFLKRFADDPDGFDVRAEGLLVMESLRRNCPRHFEDAIRPAIGGFVQMTTIERDGIKTEVLHHWPDRIGVPIDPDAKADLEDRDANYWGATFAEVYKVRETLAQWPGLPALAAGVGAEASVLLDILRGATTQTAAIPYKGARRRRKEVEGEHDFGGAGRARGASAERCGVHRSGGRHAAGDPAEAGAVPQRRGSRVHRLDDGVQALRRAA